MPNDIQTTTRRLIVHTTVAQASLAGREPAVQNSQGIVKSAPIFQVKTQEPQVAATSNAQGRTFAKIETPKSEVSKKEEVKNQPQKGEAKSSFSWTTPFSYLGKITVISLCAYGLFSAINNYVSFSESQQRGFTGQAKSLVAEGLEKLWKNAKQYDVRIAGNQFLEATISKMSYVLSWAFPQGLGVMPGEIFNAAYFNRLHLYI